ncbi:pyruvate formate-lyase-activating protein [Peptococcaceae bacterium]|nr:pyruvate formate-lyase-activating protein [Peptococcaceae bacterium]
MKGFVHSIETFGTVDGPGIRMVVFMSGCLLKCIFCHNPDVAWGEQGKYYSPEQILDKCNRNRLFYEKGGITFSGGEPLLQGQFVYQCVQLMKQNNIHVVIDTSLFCDWKWIEKIACYTDLWMVSIKAVNGFLHKKITGVDNAGIIKNIVNLNKIGADILIRYVVTPGYTDTEDELKNLARFIKNLDNIVPIELLAYHTLGVHKWKKMGINYTLDAPPASNADLEKAKAILQKSGIDVFV